MYDLIRTKLIQWMHPEAWPFIERSVSSCIWLIYIFGSNEMPIRCKSSLNAQWAIVFLNISNVVGCYLLYVNRYQCYHRSRTLCRFVVLICTIL